jgi:hypothetical protein
MCVFVVIDRVLMIGKGMVGRGRGQDAGGEE